MVILTQNVKESAYLLDPRHFKAPTVPPQVLLEVKAMHDEDLPEARPSPRAMVVEGSKDGAARLWMF